MSPGLAVCRLRRRNHQSVGAFTKSSSRRCTQMTNSSFTLLFDVEGTLIDSAPQTLESWRQTLREIGQSFNRDELQPYWGMDGAEMLDGLLPKLPDDAMEALLRQQGEFFREQYLHAVRPFPHVRATFEALRKGRVRLALATTC